MDMTFAERIRELRNDKGFSVHELARRIKTVPSYVSKIEARGEIPSPEMIFKLAEVFGVEPGELVEIAKAQKGEEAKKAVEQKYSSKLELYRRQKGKKKR